MVRHHEPFSVASGYFEEPVATVNAWRNLWFHTGDIAIRNPDGSYRFLDRLKDAIRRRGENISSWEVEEALLSHPEISGVAVIGVPSDMTEEEVMAFVEYRSEQRPSFEDLVHFLEDRLAYFAIPRFWEYVETLPMTENNKVKKHVLRSRGVTASTWDRESAGVILRRCPV